MRCSTKECCIDDRRVLSIAVRCCRHAQLQHAVVLGGGVPLEDGLEALAARYYCQVCGVATTSETNLQVRQAESDCHKNDGMRFHQRLAA